MDTRIQFPRSGAVAGRLMNGYCAVAALRGGRRKQQTYIERAVRLHSDNVVLRASCHFSVFGITVHVKVFLACYVYSISCEPASKSLALYTRWLIFPVRVYNDTSKCLQIHRPCPREPRYCRFACTSCSVLPGRIGAYCTREARFYPLTCTSYYKLQRRLVLSVHVRSDFAPSRVQPL